MCSESTSALGQPSETKPTFGAARGFFDAKSALAFGAFAASARGGLGIVLIGGEGRGEVGKLEGTEQVACLLLELLLHLQERLRTLLEVARHQALDRRTL